MKEKINFTSEDVKQMTDEDKRHFINYYDGEEFKELNDEQKAIYRKTVDELCLKNDEIALRIKGYACYGGNDIYPCNWNISKDCLMKLFKKTGDACAANSLGYIFYYGRCNYGKPQYEEAYKYFSYGAFHGIYESMYKVADMIAVGKGAPKMPVAASNLHYYVYKKNLIHFVQGNFDCKFADTALRMGNEYCNDTELAYSYCLEADYAIRKRLPFNYFGDNVVYNNIQDALIKAKERYHEYIGPAKKVGFFEWSILSLPIDTYNRSAKAVVKKFGSKTVELTISATKPSYGSNGNKNKLLFTVPEADYCELVDSITFEVKNVKKCKVAGGRNSFKYDFIQMDLDSNDYIFKHEGETVARIKGDCLIWRAPKEAKKKIKTFRFAKVEFTPGGKEYDYFCEDKSIKEGDEVIVEGIDGKKKVKVTRIFKREEDAMEMPKIFYKRVIRKA